MDTRPLKRVERDLHVLTCRDFYSCQRLHPKWSNFYTVNGAGRKQARVPPCDYMSDKERRGRMHLCTYTSTERKTEGSTPDCYRLGCDGRASGHSPGESRGGAGSKGWWQWCALTLTTRSWGRAHEQRASPAVCRPYSSRTTGASPNPPQHPILSTRRGGSKMFKSSPRSLDPRDPGATWLSASVQGREDEEHLVSTDRATNRLSHQRCGAARWWRTPTAPAPQGGAFLSCNVLPHAHRLRAFLHCSFLL